MVDREQHDDIGELAPFSRQDEANTGTAPGEKPDGV